MNSSEPEELHLGYLLRLIFQRRRFILAMVLISGFAGILYTYIVPESFQATSILVLDDSKPYLSKAAKDIADSDQVVNELKDLAGISQRENTAERFTSRASENMLFLRVVDVNPEQATKITSVWAKRVQENIASSAAMMLDENIKQLREKLISVDDEWRDTETRVRGIASEQNIPERLQDIVELETLRKLTGQQIEKSRILEDFKQEQRIFGDKTNSKINVINTSRLQNSAPAKEAASKVFLLKKQINDIDKEDQTQLKSLRQQLTKEESTLEIIIAEAAFESHLDLERVTDELNQLSTSIKDAQLRLSKVIDKFYVVKALNAKIETMEKHRSELRKKLDELEGKRSVPVATLVNLGKNIGLYRKHEWVRNCCIGMALGIILGITGCILLETAEIRRPKE